MRSKTIQAFALLMTMACCQLLFAQEPSDKPYVELNQGTLYMKSDRALNYTFHRFDPSLFLGSAHEHFNVDPFVSAEETHVIRNLKFYYPLSKLLDLELKLIHRSSLRSSSNEFFEATYNGLGDLVLGGSYQWYDSAFKSGKEGTKMRLGVFVTLPIGEYEDFTDDGELEPQMQPGRGAYGIQARHFLSKQINEAASIRWLLSYQYYTDNKYGYQFGSSVFNRVAGHYQFGATERNLGLSLGISHTHVGSDVMNARKLLNELESGEDTGGQWVNVFMKAQSTFGRITPFIETAFPVWQNLLGQQPTRRNQMILGLRFEISKKESFNVE